jgi:hypothetical protein
MSDLQACLSVFAVASWANTDASLGQAEKAIDLYEDKMPTRERLGALLRLKMAFDGMLLCSNVARAIKARLDQRIGALSFTPSSAVDEWKTYINRSD